MKRIKKRRRSSPWISEARNPFDVGGLPLGGMAHPRASTRRGRGRLGRKLKMGASESKPPAPVGKQQPTAKALARWENEGGRPAPRATSDQPKKTEAIRAPKKSVVTKHSPKKAKPKPGTSVAQDRH